MISRENIICISSIDWDFVWQGHQEIMSTFASNGNRVLFIENTGVRSPHLKDLPRLKKRLTAWLRNAWGFREETKNIFVYSPLCLPFPYSGLAHLINKYLILRPLLRWMKASEFHNPIIWTFLPTPIVLDIVNAIDNKLLIYYCIADFYELTSNYRMVRKSENSLIEKCDLIFAQGAALEKKCRRLNNNVHIFPFGVKIEAFDNFRQGSGKIPDKLSGIKEPIIGYVGGIHRHIDFKLITFLAMSHPEWSIVLIGPVQANVSDVSRLDNIFLLGQKEFFELPYYINRIDVGIVPYKLNSYMLTVFPTKLNEYHAMGKPVVSTELPEVLNFNKENDNLVYTTKTYQEFSDCILQSLSENSEELRNKRILSARKNSWTSRIAQMSGLIEKTIDKKNNAPINWKGNFAALYRIARRKMLKFAAITSALYLLAFYTPLVWFMASSLTISQAPEKADCIVVFAGGVGESGKPAQGYEERVRYAVDLYKQGFSSHLLFSSGYSYVFNEPLIMKALAVSLGVPAEAVIVEDQAKNTYENILFSKRILNKYSWNRILLVSSPYHMKRVFLVARKHASSIEIIYTPIKESMFYRHGVSANGRKAQKQINLSQIKALVHECIAILYYWHKGFI